MPPSSPAGTIASLDRDGQCQGDDWGYVIIVPRDEGTAHAMLAVSRIGEADSLSAAAEREILATFTAPGR